MDEEENSQLDEIHTEVQGSHAQLGAINERTLAIQRQLESVNEDVSDNDKEIDKLQGKVKRNTTIMTGVSSGIAMIAIWASDKILRLL